MTVANTSYHLQISAHTQIKSRLPGLANMFHTVFSRMQKLKFEIQIIIWRLNKRARCVTLGVKKYFKRKKLMNLELVSLRFKSTYHWSQKREPSSSRLREREITKDGYKHPIVIEMPVEPEEHAGWSIPEPESSLKILIRRYLLLWLVSIRKISNPWDDLNNVGKQARRRALTLRTYKWILVQCVIFDLNSRPKIC